MGLASTLWVWPVLNRFCVYSIGLASTLSVWPCTLSVWPCTLSVWRVLYRFGLCSIGVALYSIGVLYRFGLYSIGVLYRFGLFLCRFRPVLYRFGPVL